MKNNMVQKLSHSLAPQMIQTMEILQMGTQELLEFVNELGQENPVLEVDEVHKPQEDESQIANKIEWLAAKNYSRYDYRQESDDSEEADIKGMSVDPNDESLCHYALSQLKSMKLPRKCMKMASLIVESLDQNGWLDEDLTALASEAKCGDALAREALKLVQSLEPAGIGARSLSECLCIQLKRFYPGNKLALDIAAGHLDKVSKSHYGILSRILCVSPEDIREACDLIRSLNPRPSLGFSSDDRIIYVTPDIIVAENQNCFEIQLNENCSPNLSISNYYCRLLKESDDGELKEYLMGKIRQAKWVVQSIEQRKDTLLSCARSIVNSQIPFFRNGAGHLSPLSLADVASELGVHESTVSRAIRDKYLQCAAGVYPLSYFFVRSVGRSTDTKAPAPSTDTVKSLLKSIISSENSKKPLSDQKICETLKEQGHIISRRTVAKYRDELGIPNTIARKTID